MKTPTHLSPASKKWFAVVVRDYELAPHHLRLLQLAAEAWDRCQEARAQLAEEGLTVIGKAGLRAHPSVGIERDARLAFARLVRELDLDVQAPSPYRAAPPPLRSNR